MSDDGIASTVLNAIFVVAVFVFGVFLCILAAGIFFGGGKTWGALVVGVIGLIFIGDAVKASRRGRRDNSTLGKEPPTQKQLDFARELGINSRGLGKWELSRAIDEELSRRKQ